MPRYAPGITAVVWPAGSVRAATQAGFDAVPLWVVKERSADRGGVRRDAINRRVARHRTSDHAARFDAGQQVVFRHRLHRAATVAPEGEQIAARGERSGRSHALRPVHGSRLLHAGGEEGDPAVTQFARAPDKVHPVFLAGVSGDLGAVVVDREQAQVSRSLAVVTGFGGYEEDPPVAKDGGADGAVRAERQPAGAWPGLCPYSAAGSWVVQSRPALGTGELNTSSPWAATAGSIAPPGIWVTRSGRPPPALTL